MKYLRLILLGLILAALLLSATPVYADTPDPDSTPTVDEINIYRNVLETGDWLMIIYANIPYATLPDTPVTSTFRWQLMDTDNTTELGNTVGSNYNDDGYGYNVYSMYWDAANVTAQSMVWGTNYQARLSGNPAVFDTPPVYNFIVNTADYSALTATADVKVAISARVLILAGDLDNKWGLAVVYSLLTQNETATALSIYGEAFFRGAIFGLQAMAPYAFSVVIRVIDIDDRVWDEEYSENLTVQWSGTWVETSQEAGKALFGTEYDLLSIIILLGLSGALLYGNISLTGDHWNGFIDCAVLSVMGARLAMYDLAFLGLVVFMCFFYISAKVWYGGIVK